MRPVQHRRLTIRADTGDSKNMKAQNMQPDVPEQMCGPSIALQHTYLHMS